MRPKQFFFQRGHSNGGQMIWMWVPFENARHVTFSPHQIPFDTVRERRTIEQLVMFRQRSSTRVGRRWKNEGGAVFGMIQQLSHTNFRKVRLDSATAPQLQIQMCKMALHVLQTYWIIDNVITHLNVQSHALDTVRKWGRRQEERWLQPGAEFCFIVCCVC